MEIVYFFDQDGLAQYSEEHGTVPEQLIVNFSEFTFASKRDTIFVITHTNSEAVSRIVHALRQDPRTGLQPLYTTKTFGKPLDLLVDGSIETEEDIADKSGPILEHLLRLNETVFLEDANDYIRVLALLYSRPNMRLAPHRVWLDEYAYAYSLLEAMLGSAHIVASRLATLCEWQYLHRKNLVDRTTHCPICSSLQINYIDLCPNCKHSDIEEQLFISCNHCHSSEPEEAFLQDDYLFCNNCKRILRQVKEDYDWVQGNFHCRSCGYTFRRAEIQAHCLCCGTVMPIERLLVRQVYNYELTEEGVAAAIAGKISTSFQEHELKIGNQVNPVFFINMINWLLDFCGRHNSEAFTLLGIRINSAANFDNTDVRRGVMDLCDSFVFRLREHIRSADLLSRFDQKTIWLLLPKTGEPEFQVVLKRVKNLQIEHEGLASEKLTFSMVAFHAPDDIVADETSAYLLDRLTREMEEIESD